MKIINASHFSLKKIDTNLTVYTSNNNFIAINSIEDALNSNTWKNNFNPFAYVIVDSQKNKIVLVRDHLGIEPLYYYRDQKQFVFGNTLPDILKNIEKASNFSQSQIQELFSEEKKYSDDTLYENIYRVEPGHLMYFHSNHKEKKVFWQLEREGDTLFYKNDNDYLDHFSELMRESTALATGNTHNVAAEFSAGIDSSAVYCAAKECGHNPKLYMHTALPNTTADSVYNKIYENEFIKHFNLSDIQRIAEENFDPISVFKQYSEWFAGSPPYIFFMFANNIHKAVSDNKHSILLSGFGGDQGVSAEIPLCFFMPELLRKKEYRKAWHHLSNTTLLKKIPQYLQFSNPGLYALSHKIRNKRHKKIFTHPYISHYYSSIREAEWLFLQGPFSHEIRMRIEYSSIVSKKMGFEYRYPLLYPKLLEFFLSLPLEQKRRDGIGRYLMRRYMAQHVPAKIFNTYHKSEGLGIVAATFDSFNQKLSQGDFDNQFQNLPYENLIKHPITHLEQVNRVKGFMLKNAISSLPSTADEAFSSCR